MEREAKYFLMPAWSRLFSLCLGSTYSSLASVLLFGLLYYLLGWLGWMFSLELKGLSVAWLPVGMAFFIVLFGGYRLAFSPLIGMSLLAAHLEFPLPVAFGSAVGAMLESLIPVLVLRSFGFDPRLERIRDVMLFIAFAVILGPLITATLGTLGFAYSDVSSTMALSDLWLSWWLGNSVGCLLVAGFLLAWSTSKPGSLTSGCRLFLLSLLGGVVLVSILSVSRLSLGQPTLLLFASLPLIVFAAAYCGRQGATLLSVGAMVISLLGMDPTASQAQGPQVAGLFSLDVAVIWVTAFTGLVVASAYSERGAGAVYAYLAEHDGLTRLINRSAFEGRLSRALASAKLDGRSQVHTLMFLDLDDFKRINDQFGHASGDQVLRRISTLLTSQVRSRDTVARLGGDEFVVLLENCTADSAKKMVERIAVAIRQMSIPVKGQVCRITASIGVIPIGANTGDLESVLSAADAAHYQAKGEGKNRVVHLGSPESVGDEC